MSYIVLRVRGCNIIVLICTHQVRIKVIIQKTAVVIDGVWPIMVFSDFYFILELLVSPLKKAVRIASDDVI